jgi:NAD(P)-dependent dehydrogenase (short-subunit alcohol dehydrogenase family)
VSDRRVVVVTGGGGGIGRAIAEDVARHGAFVVTVDPLVSVDGSEQVTAPEETTADRIVAAGGAAMASNASVTDRDAIHALFAELVEDNGRLDAVVNVAGITRPTGFAKGTEKDWSAVLSVHLDGYRNVLEAALPIMARAGRGHILGVTSGSGWRAADAGAYSCAKRAVASLTWQLGRAAPPGVFVNAISPIAVTRMVTEALARAGGGAAAGASGKGAATGGLSLGSMPEPEQLGPFGAYLVGPDQQWCQGQVLFAGGSEVAVIEPPRLIEVVRTSGASPAAVVESVAPALVTAEARQATTGGSNPRFATVFDPGLDASSDPEHPPSASTVAIVTDRPDLLDALEAQLAAGGATTLAISPSEVAAGFEGAHAVLDAAADQIGPLDGIVVALSTPTTSVAVDGWARVLVEHEGIVDEVASDARWARAAADRATATERSIRLVTLVDAVTAGGRSRAQASAQLARAAQKATADRVSATTVSVEGGDVATVAALTAHLLASDADAAPLGAELVVADGWFGLRSHPRVSGSIVFGGPPLPPWFDGALRELVEG